VSDTIDVDDLLRQLTAGTPSRTYLLAIMPVVLDRLRAAESRVKRLESQAQDAFHLHVSTEEQLRAAEARVTALTATGRAVLPVCYDEVTDGLMVATVCRVCGSFEPTQHSEGCAVGAWAALLTEATPSMQAGAGEGV
jgi:hypothetical protein